MAPGDFESHHRIDQLVLHVQGRILGLDLYVGSWGLGGMKEALFFFEEKSNCWLSWFLMRLLLWLFDEIWWYCCSWASVGRFWETKRILSEKGCFGSSSCKSNEIRPFPKNPWNRKMTGKALLAYFLRASSIREFRYLVGPKFWRKIPTEFQLNYIYI